MTAQAGGSFNTRLARLETKHDNLKERIDQQESRLEATHSRLSTTDLSIGEIRTELRWIKWVLLVGIPGLLLLQGWELFAG